MKRLTDEEAGAKNMPAWMRGMEPEIWVFEESDFKNQNRECRDRIRQGLCPYQEIKEQNT